MQFLSQQQIQPSVHTFIFKPEQPTDWQPGQYMHYTFPHPGADSRGVERWFTISSAPYEQNIHITTRLAADRGSSFKAALLALKPGDMVEADGPKGSFTLRPGVSKHVLIAGGIGITPYHSMLAQLGHEHKPANADLLYANSDEHFTFGDELDKLAAADRSLQIVKFAGKRITEADLTKYLADKQAVFYLSGPEAMVQSYEGLLGLLGVDEANVATDYFPGY